MSSFVLKYKGGLKMTSTLNFQELKNNELEMIDGGGWKAASAAFAGTVIIATSPIVAATGNIGGAFKYGKAGYNLVKWACDNFDE